MPNSPTIVSAALSDKELQASINQMVANFDKGLQTMLEHSNEYIGKIQESLQKIGNTNFGAKGSNDGGVAKQTKAQNEFTDVVKKSTNEIKKQNQEAAMSFDQIAAAQQKAVQSQGDSTLKKSFNRQELQQYIDRLRELQAEYIKVNTQEGAGAKSDKIKADMRNLEELIAKYREILRNLDYVNSRQGTIDVKKWVQDLSAVDDRYKKLTRWYTVLEKEDQRRIASEEKANQRRLADLEKEKAAQDKVIKSYQDSVLKAEVGKVMKMPTTNIDEIRAKFERLSTIIANIRELGILSPEKISAADSEVKKLGASIQRYEKFEQERIAAEQKFVIEQAKEVEQTQTLEGRVKGLAQAAREYMKANSDSRWSSSAYGKDLTIYAEGDVRARGLSIEEQIRRQLEAEQQVIQQQVNTSQQLNNERKKYVSPTINDDIYQITRNAIARKLGIDASKVINADASTDSIKRVSSALKQLQDAYAKMDASERKSPIGQHMIRQMQELERQTQQLRAQMSRPISLKDALGGSEKTLDDIAYKMQRLRAYKQGIDLTKPNATNEIKQVDEALAKLQKDADKWMSKSQQMIKSNTALGRSWNYMKNRLAFYVTVGAGTSFVKQLIDIRGQYELLERSIGILIDSAQNGSQIFAELNAMAIKSPFTTMELGAAAKQLVAYDVAAKDVVDTTRRLADMAAAVGIPIERLTYALGQIKAYGYLNARDARMFANAGIPLVKELADRYTELEGRLVSTADVYDRIKKKAISYEDVMATVNKMTDDGGKFFNFQEKAADTLKVRIANLTLAWNNMLNEMGAANQSVLSSGLKTLSDVFKNWRSIYNLITSIIVTFGVLKATQVVVLTIMAMHIKKNITLWSALELAMRKSMGDAVVNNLRSIGNLLARFSSPLTLSVAVVTALGVAIGKAVLDYKDLIAANEAFNKSISDNAKENIESIEKFFEDYKKQLSNIGELNNADQEKLWERIQEEIEKTTKNAEDYIRVLEKVGNTSSRIRLGEDVLEQSKTIQREIQRLADSGTFSIGGGFANDSAAKNLQNYQEALNEIRQEYGSVNAAIEAHTMKSRKLMADYTTQRNEVRAELNDFVSKLDNAYMPDILGQSDDVRIQMANLRSFAESLRDSFIATEEGSKIGADGIVLLNNAIDKWITKQSVANNLIVNANGYFDEQRAKIEENKTAWEKFFSYISKKDREYLDAAIKTNNIGSDEVKKIWDKAAEEMSKRATTSYDLIQDQIAQLRNTPDIVINVVYRNEKEKLDKDQEEFEKKYIQPKGWGVLSTDEYIKREKANREKYGTLMRKQGEDTAEYEKRISDERKKNLELSEKNGKIIEENKNKTSKYSIAVTELADKEKKAADDRLKVIKEIEKDSGYDFSTKSERTAAKQAESELAKALKDELSTIDKVRSIYKDLTKEGMSHANAVERATRGWNETVNAINKVLRKNGLQKLDLSKFAGIENPRELVNMLQSQLNTLLKRGAKHAEIKELQTKVNTLEVDADKYDLTKITKGLNNELGKLKDEYELAVELDANPELGDMFADMFGINTSTLPKTFGEALDRAQTIINRKLAEMDITTPFDLMEGNIDSFAKSTGLDKDGAVIKELVSAQNAYRDMFKKNVTETEKMLDDYIKKYGDYSDKIAEIEAGRLEKLKKLNEAYYTEEMRKRPEYAAKLNAIEQGASKEKQQIDFDEFKNSRYYTMMFENLDYISTKTIRDMRDRVRELIDTMNDLTPEQLKTLMSQYEKLEQKLVKRSPFKTLTKDLKEYFATSKERKVVNQEFKNAQKEYDAQKKNVAALKEKYEQAKANSNTSKSRLDFLQIEIDGENEILKTLKEQLDAAQKKADKYNLTSKLAKSEALAVANIVGQNLQSLGELRDFIQQDLGVELSDELNGLVDGLSKVGQGINKITSSATSGDIVGVITGVGQTIYGIYDGIASIFGGGSTSDKKITKQIQDSERAVKRLELAYKNLEFAIENAYGANVIGAKQAAIANKELQLAEMRRQLALEKSRDSKKRDDDRIMELQGQIIDLQNDIKRSAQEIATELLGISNVGDAALSFMDAYISALRKGEDAQAAFTGSWKEMIANMIKQIWVTKVIGPQLEALVDEINERIKKRSSRETKLYEQASEEQARISTMSDDEIRKAIFKNKTGRDWKEYMWFHEEWSNIIQGITQSEIDAYRNDAEKRVYQAQKDLNNATLPTIDDLDLVAQAGKDLLPLLESSGNNLNSLLERYDLFEDQSDKTLSALQQGLQGVSEETASAVEAYLNGMSQQAYLRNDLLTQIRDTIISFDMDVQLGVFSQMLLQLQNNYIVMQSMQSMMENWTVPSGSGIRVELMS